MEVKENATMIYRRDLSAETCILRISPESGEVPPFEAGQYAEIAFPPDSPAERTKLVRRAYSIASPPSERSYLEFFVVLVEEGQLTPKLWPHQVGGRLWLGPKIKGKFTLEGIPHGKDIVMVATGTGLAPFVSMVRQYHGQARWRKLVIIHSSCFQKDLGYKEELENFSRENNDIIYLPTVTREDSSCGWSGCTGRVQQFFDSTRYQDLVDAPLDPVHTHVLLCGNPAMIDSMEELLLTKGFKHHTHKQPGNIHYERYW